MRRSSLAILIVIELLAIPANAAEDAPQFERDIAPLVKRHCVKCHGPTKQEAKLNLSTLVGLMHGGMSGATLVPRDLDASLLWKRVTSDEMPPDAPLSSDEKSLLKRWIVVGTPGLSRKAIDSDSAEHWAFRRLPLSERRELRSDSNALPTGKSNAPSTSATASSVQSTEYSVLSTQYSTLDTFITTDLARDGLTVSPEANRTMQIRRVSFDLTGLPPTSEEIRNSKPTLAPMPTSEWLIGSSHHHTLASDSASSGWTQRAMRTRTATSTPTPIARSHIATGTT